MSQSSYQEFAGQVDNSCNSITTRGSSVDAATVNCVNSNVRDAENSNSAHVSYMCAREHGVQSRVWSCMPKCTLDRAYILRQYENKQAWGPRTIHVMHGDVCVAMGLIRALPAAAHPVPRQECTSKLPARQA